MRAIERRRIRQFLNKAKRHSNGGLNFQRRRHSFQARKARAVAIWVLEVAAVIAAAFLLAASFGVSAICAEESMEPTVMERDRVLLDKWAYLFGTPQAGDVVVFRPAGNVNAQCSIKRIIAVPGDRVLIARGNVYVNGKEYEDFVDVESIRDPGRAQDEVLLGEGEYFVLGDNRNNSEDSRYETIGNITQEEIEGKAWFVCSFEHFGLIS